MELLKKIKFKANLRYLNKLREITGQCSKLAGLYDLDKTKIEMAVDEACYNIIIHSYKNYGSKPLFLSFRSDDEIFSIIYRRYRR